MVPIYLNYISEGGRHGVLIWKYKNTLKKKKILGKKEDRSYFHIKQAKIKTNNYLIKTQVKKMNLIEKLYTKKFQDHW